MAEKNQTTSPTNSLEDQPSWAATQPSWVLPPPNKKTDLFYFSIFQKQNHQAKQGSQSCLHKNWPPYKTNIHKTLTNQICQKQNCKTQMLPPPSCLSQLKPLGLKPKKELLWSCWLFKFSSFRTIKYNENKPLCTISWIWSKPVLFSFDWIRLFACDKKIDFSFCISVVSFLSLSLSLYLFLSNSLCLSLSLSISFSLSFFFFLPCLSLPLSLIFFIISYYTKLSNLNKIFKKLFHQTSKGTL